MSLIIILVGGGVKYPSKQTVSLNWDICGQQGTWVAAAGGKKAAHPIQMLRLFKMVLFQLHLPLRGI